MKEKILNLKNHIHDRRGRYASAGTAIAFLLIMNRTGNEITEFLIEKGIDPQEYFNPEAYLEGLGA